MFREQRRHKDRLLRKEQLCSTEKGHLSEDEDTSSMDAVGRDQLLTVSSNRGTRRNSNEVKGHCHSNY